jgi:hypothetical protein
MARQVIWKLIAEKIPPLIKKGLDKSQIRDKIFSLKKFSNQKSAFFKERKTPQGSNYASTFDRAWNSLKLPPVDPKVSGAKAGKTAWKKRYADPDAYAKYVKGQKENQLKQIQIAFRTKNPKTGEMGYSENPTIQNIIDFSNAGGKSQSPSTYAELQQRFAKQFGKGDLRKLRKPQNKELYADFNEAFNKRRMEAQLIKQGLLDEFTPANQLLTKYGRQGWENVLDERKALTDLVFDESKIGKYLLDLGYDRNQIIASIGHDYPLEQFATLLAGKGRPNITPFRSTRLVTKPENIRAELNFMNQAKARGIEPFLYEKPLWYADDLNIINKIMKDAQLTSKFYGPTGTRQKIGMPGKDIDPKQLLEYLKYIHKDKPFGSSKFPRTLPTRDDILALIHGKKKYNFQAGGLASLLGKKLLKKLANKLSEKELKMLMGSLWKGVDPRRSPRYRAWDKNRWGPGYKWPYQKSRVKGPEIKKSHFASLTPGERVELQAKNADELWEYQMKKKLNKPMNEALEYPFLNPDKNSFIVTGPREGLGRYQLQHYVDPEDVKPVQKYKVYDWWDDVLNKMRKNPKFKYVKDNKGKIILKEAK